MGPSAAYLQKENFVRKRNCSKKRKKSNIFKKGTWMANVLIGCVCLKKNQYVYLGGTMENDDSVSNNSRKEEKKRRCTFFFLIMKVELKRLMFKLISPSKTCPVSFFRFVSFFGLS